jgi:hypothetical protein
MIHGVMNCTTLTPKLPMPAWIASAVPCRRLGKNRLVEGMKELKLPPPRPARNARVRSIQYGVSGFCTAQNQPSAGISSDRVENVTTWRVP